MNMFKATKEKTIASYLAAVPADRKPAMLALHALIRTTVPKLKPHFAINMIGYGTFPYVNAKKEKGTWPVISLANQKQYISVYVCATEGGKYLAEARKKELGKVSVGKSCIRFKKLEDLDLAGFRKVLRIAAKTPGLVSANMKKK